MSSPAEFVEKFINQTNEPVFLTGKAGTGKTTLLRKIVEHTHKQTVIVAPTGIAALNAGGVTIHSFFQLPFAGFIPDFLDEMHISGSVKLESKKTLIRHFKMNKERQQLIRSLELLIVDEVSMLRADLLDAIDWTLRNVRDINLPFGGVQVLFIGDLFQLPPVIKPAEWSVLHKYYAGIHFFNAQVIVEKPPLYIELSKIFRQQNEDFIEILNNLRNNSLTEKDLQLLNTKVQPDFEPAKEEGVITLTTHNAKADKINESALDNLTTKLYRFDAEVTGDFPQHLYPLEERLELKEGAQVMFIKNDLGMDKQFYNGKMGVVTELTNNEIIVECTEDKKVISVERAEWENVRFTKNETSGEIEEETIGTFVHFPLKLAWAITVHKSQGLTFDKAALEVSQVFAPGQAYVAFSRLRSLEGLVLLSPIKLNGLQNDEKIIQFSSRKSEMEQLDEHLEKASHFHLYSTLEQAFDWSNLAAKFRSHEASFEKVSKKSEKAKHHPWASVQNQTIQRVIEPAKKFRTQLRNIFAQQPLDQNKLKERMDAALGYFMPILEQVYMSNLKKIGELSRISKIKAVLEELQELEQELFEVIIQLKKNEILLEAFLNGRSVSKDLFEVNSIQNFRITKMELVKQELQTKQSLFAEDQPNYSKEIFFPSIQSSKSEKKKKEKRIPTHEKTLAMLKEGKDIALIAEERSLSEKTIYGHLEKCIMEEKLEDEDVLTPQTLTFLKEHVDFDKAENLTQLKEQVGDDASWEELKIYRAGHLR